MQPLDGRVMSLLRRRHVLLECARFIISLPDEAVAIGNPAFKLRDAGGMGPDGVASLAEAPLQSALFSKQTLDQRLVFARILLVLADDLIPLGDPILQLRDPAGMRLDRFAGVAKPPLQSALFAK